MILGAAVALPSLAGDPKAAQTLKAKRLSLAAPGMVAVAPLSAAAAANKEDRKSLSGPLGSPGSAIAKENRKSVTSPLISSQSAVSKEGTG